MTHRAEEDPFDPLSFWQRLVVFFCSWWFRQQEKPQTVPPVKSWEQLVDEVLARGDGNVTELVCYLLKRRSLSFSGEVASAPSSDELDYSDDQLAQGAQRHLRSQLLSVVSNDEEWAKFIQDEAFRQSVCNLILFDDWELYIS